MKPNISRSTARVIYARTQAQNANQIRLRLSMKFKHKFKLI